MGVIYPSVAGTWRVIATTVTSETVTQFQGRVQKAEWNKGVLRLQIQDNLKNLSWAKFIWDYDNGAQQVGSDWYGTVTEVRGSNIYWNDAYGTKYIWRIGGEWTAYAGAAIAVSIWGPAAGAAVLGFTLKWKEKRRFYDLDVLPDDYIIEGDYLKFSPGNFSGTEAGGTLLNNPIYRVRGGTVISNIGTIELSPQPLAVDIQPGHFIYVRRPLFYTGNPADIIWDMLTGTNTDVGWDSTGSISNPEIDYDQWLKSRISLVPLGHAEYYHEIQDEGTGAVIQAIQQISRDCLANAFIDNQNRFVWKAYHPRSVPVGTDVRHYHQATAVKDLIYWEDIEDIFTKVVIDYQFNPDPVDERFIYSGRVERVDTQGRENYYGLNKVMHWQSEWIRDRNFARQQSIRFLKRYAANPSRVQFDSSLYGLMGTTTGFMGLTHDTGQLATTVYEIARTQRRLSDRRVLLEGLNASDLYYGKGFGFWEENWAGGTGPGTTEATLYPETVSGTSTGGWGSLLNDAGQSPVGSGGTCFGIGTTVYGTVYKWW